MSLAQFSEAEAAGARAYEGDAEMVSLLSAIDVSVAKAEEEAVGLSGSVDAGEGFAIETRDQAEYYTRRLVEAQRHDAAVKAAAKKRIQEYTERVKAWEESELKEHAFDVERWTSLLRIWAEKEIVGSKKKSIKLVEGTLSFHKDTEIKYDDEKLIPYLKKNYKYLLVEQEPKVDKLALKKKFNLEKDKIPGVTFIQKPDSFSVK